jgi:hypothetical protein
LTELQEPKEFRNYRMHSSSELATFEVGNPELHSVTPELLQLLNF